MPYNSHSDKLTLTEETVQWIVVWGMSDCLGILIPRPWNTEILLGLWLTQTLIGSEGYPGLHTSPVGQYISPLTSEEDLLWSCLAPDWCSGRLVACLLHLIESRNAQGETHGGNPTGPPPQHHTPSLTLLSPQHQHLVHLIYWKEVSGGTILLGCVT